MIRIDQELTFEGVTVYRDEYQRNKFYILPNQPRFRLDDSGKPVFKFIKYRLPLDRPDGKKGGGFVIFDSEFVVPEDKLKKVQSALDEVVASEKIVRDQPAQIGELTFTRGTATLQLLDSGGALVQKVQSAGKPSLYGHNVCSFTAELSPEGAAVIEAAMQGGGGMAQVIYDLYFITKVPPIGGHVWFRAEKFYSYWQSIDKTESHWWNGNSGEYRDTRREQFRSSDSGGVDFHFDWVLPDAEQDAKLKNKIRDWGWSSLEDAVKRLVLTDPAANTETGLPDGVHHVTRDFSTDKTASFDRYFRESDAVEWHVVPQGTLPNITTLPGVKWKDYAVEVDANDPFFKTLNVNVGVNADFKKFGLNSVDVHLDYTEGRTHAVTNPDFHLTSPDQRMSFQSYIENGNWKFRYAYRVNYLGDSRSFDFPAAGAELVETDRTALTIDVGDLGLLSVEVIAAGINWDQVASAEVSLWYEDPASDVARVDQTYVLTKADNRFHWLEVILARRTAPYHYEVKYTMVNGLEYKVTNLQGSSPELYVDDPFYTKVLHVRSLRDFTKEVDSVFVDLSYTDAKLGYRQQQSIALNKGQTFYDWAFPALTGSKGELRYSGKVRYQDGSTETIPDQPALFDTIYVPEDLPVLEVNIEPSLIDWTKVKLAVVHLEYADPGNAIDEQKSVSLKNGVAAGAWRVRVKDKTKKTFTWWATYYLADPAAKPRSTKPTPTDDPLVVLDLAAAEPTP